MLEAKSPPDKFEWLSGNHVVELDGSVSVTLSYLPTWLSQITAHESDYIRARPLFDRDRPAYKETPSRQQVVVVVQ